MAKGQGSSPREKVTFDLLLDKYTKEKAVTSDRRVKKNEVTYSSRETRLAAESGYKTEK